jgi:RimJ/RimL family protein N-acetyltransferase
MHIHIPRLTTARLALRAPSLADLDAVAAMQADAETMRFIGDGSVRDRATSAAGWARLAGLWVLHGAGHWTIADPATDAFLGRMGFLFWDGQPAPELAYAVIRDRWGQGLATEACRAALAWAWAERDWPFLLSFVRPENAASAGVCRRLGATEQDPITLMGGTARVFRHDRPS